MKNFFIHYKILAIVKEKIQINPKIFGNTSEEYKKRKEYLITSALEAEKALMDFPEIQIDVPQKSIKSIADRIESIPDVIFPNINKDKLKNNYIMVRHGQTFGNLKNTLNTAERELNLKTGTLLTPLGKEQVAENCKLYLKEHPKINPENVVLVTSDFARTLETSAIVAANFKLSQNQIFPSPLLRDRAFGIFNEKPGKFANYIILQNIVNPYWKVSLKPGFESQTTESNMDVFMRVKKLIDQLESKYQGKTIILVTHLDPTSITYLGYNNLPINKFSLIKPVGNGEFVSLN